MRTNIKLPVVFLLALGTGAMVSTSTDLATHARVQAEARASGASLLADFQTEAFGGAFLNVDRPVGPVVGRIINFGDRIAPDAGRPLAADRDASGLCPPSPSMCGALTPLRNMLRIFATILLVPFSLLALLVLLIRTGGNQMDDGLKMIVVRLFLVVMALQWYAWWDYTLFRGVTVPMVQVLSRGNVVDDMIRLSTMEKRSSGVWLPNEDLKSTTDEDDVSGRSTELATAAQRCLVALEESVDSEDARKTCDPETVSGEVNASAGRLAVSSATSDIERTYAKLTEDPLAWTGNWLLKFPGAERAAEIGSTTRAMLAATGEVIRNPFAYISNVIGNTIAGILLQLQSIIMVVVLWVIWLGTMIARAFSLALAPIAFAWSLLPDAKDRMMQWFESHAKIVFMPLVYAMGFLVFYVAQVGAYTTGILGENLVIGLGMQLAMVCIFIVLCFKMKTLFNAAGGDVTRISSEIGSAITCVAVKGAMAFATGGASAAVMSYGGGAAAGAPTGRGAASGPVQMSRKQTASGLHGEADRTYTGLGGHLADFDPENAKAPKAPGRLGRLKGKLKGEVASVKKGLTAENTKGVLKDGWQGIKGGFSAASATIGNDLMDSNDFTKAVNDKRKEWKAQKEKAGEGRAPGVAAVDSDLVAVAGAANAARKAENQMAQKEGRAPDHPAPLDGEVIGVKGNDIKIKANDAHEAQQINALATAMASTREGVWIDPTTSPSGVEGIAIEPESLVALNREYWQNEALRKLILSDPMAASVKWIQTADGEMPDLQELAKVSTLFAEAVTVAAAANAHRFEEIARRDQLTRTSGTASGSVQDVLLREMPEEVLEALVSAAPADKHVPIIQTTSKFALRLAFANTAEGKKLLGNNVNDVQAIAENNSATIGFDIDDAIAEKGWTSAAGMNNMATDPARAAEVQEARDAFKKAYREIERYTQEARAPEHQTISIRGKQFGLDEEVYRRTLGQVEQWKHEKGSLFDAALTEHKGDHKKAMESLLRKKSGGAKPGTPEYEFFLSMVLTNG
jgi:hypothetical protein